MLQSHGCGQAVVYIVRRPAQAPLYRGKKIQSLAAQQIAVARHATMLRSATEWSLTYLENLFRIRPVGVVSKKIIGDLNMAKAIRSCSLLNAHPC